MPYLTQPQYIDRFGESELIELTDRGVEPLEMVDANVFAKAEADAAAIIDGYLRSRYVVPIATVTGDLRVHAGGLTRGILFRDQKPEAVQLDWNAAMSWLRDVQSGRVLLDAATALPSTTGGSVGECEFNVAANDFAGSY